MFSYGSQVNPALLRQDFSSILQGAQAQAQGIQQAAATRAQAMAGIGSQISEGFKTYVKNREQNSVLDGRIGRILNSRPELANDPELKSLFEERAKKGGLPLDKSQKLYSALETTLELDKAKQEQKARELTMEVNRFQLDKARADNQRAENDRRAYGTVFKEASRLGRMPNQDELFQLGLYEGMSPEAVASVTGMSQNSAEFGMKMNQYAEQIAKLRAENAQVAARNNRINGYLTSMPNGFRVVKDGQNDVFQSVNWETGELTNKLLEKGDTPQAIQTLEYRQTGTSKIFKAYTELLSRPDRDQPENIKARNELVTQFNILNPKDDVQMNQTRENLDSIWGLQSPVATTNPPPPGKGGGGTPPPGKSNITGVSPAAPGAQPTPAPAAAPQSLLSTSGGQAAAFGSDLMPNLNRATPFAFSGGQAASTPAFDTSVGAPTPAAPPPVDLSVPPSIAAAIRFGDTAPEGPTPTGTAWVDKTTNAAEKALKSAMRWADKNLNPKGKVGLNSLADSLSKPAFEAAREEELREAQYLARKSDTPLRTFDEAMTNFGYRKSGGGQWEYKGPAFRAGTGTGSEETWMRGRVPDALIPSFLSPSPGADFGGAQPVSRAVEDQGYLNPFAKVGTAAYESIPAKAMGSSRAFSAPPAERARVASAAPQFLDKDALATAAAMQAGMETPLPFERYKTPEQGAIPQIKLSPAAQKIASELRRSAESGERGKAPQFFLESSTGDDGKRTRVKLDKNELFAILTNNRMPSSALASETVDRAATDKLAQERQSMEQRRAMEQRSAMEQQMRMNSQKIRQYRPPPYRGR